MRGMTALKLNNIVPHFLMSWLSLWAVRFYFDSRRTNCRSMNVQFDFLRCFICILCLESGKFTLQQTK
ncbi:hypothetical protein QN277_027600 [Acacia crassicarpa]|uniref:Uncharacterized protein n=1 Tax=Acacia crassicarpa TaxID=499986 RepID=A0AAE1J412_9FABA|nr:hypothetical protein QN277_027600 [Acacia crassicarpa]